jgi:hypothetical protein
MYAGTGEGFGNLDAVQGGGIFRTQDGVHWSQLPSTAPLTTSNFLAVNRLAMSSDGKVLLAATSKGIFRSVDEGATWSQQLFADVAGADFHPSDPSRALAGGRDDGHAYYSLNGGMTWKNATHSGFWGGRVELAYARKDPSIVFASVNTNGGEIWRSSNGGESYSLARTGSGFLGEQGWYDNVIWAGDPTSADLVVVGGIDLWRSVDAGRTLIRISDWSNPGSAHADHHSIVAHPMYDGANNLAVFFGNDGGIYKASNVKTVQTGSGWTPLNNTLDITQFYGVAGNINSGTVIGGAQDNGTLRYRPSDGANKWTEMEGGDGGFCAADPEDPNVLYGEYVYLNVHRSSDGGATAEYISGSYWDGSAWVWKPEPYQIPDANNNAANFIAPFVLDPNEPNRIVAGGLSLWRTSNAKAPNTNTTGPSWESIKTPIGFDPFTHSISAIAVTKGDSSRLWVGHNNGFVFRTSNGTATNPTWTRVDNGSTPLPKRYCNRITVDPSNPARVYVTFGGYSSDNVWKSTNDGATWTNISSSLPSAPVHSLVVHPVRADLLYIGTEVGVFASENGGASWSPTNEGPTNCAVDELLFLGKTLVTATHGRGMFKIDIP